MPEGYTHFRIAAKAAAAVRYKVKWPAAFAAGANGPDIFFCFEAWRKAAKRRYDLPALGRRMHEENTGAFLQSLVRHVRTAPQVEYALGFLSHYAADTVLHPYVAALCRPGMPYAEPGGHGYFEIALDSTLHAQDTGSAVVPSQEACPTPAGEALADIVDLLHTALREAYGLDIPAEYLADSFYYSTKLRGMFTSRYGVRKAFFGLIEPLFGGRGTITGHVSPRKLRPDLPDAWCDPTTGEPRAGDVYALMEQAQERSAQYMAAAILIWNGRQTYAFLDDLLGSMSYSTGTATAQSDPSYVPPEPPPEPSKEAEATQTPADGQAPAAEKAAPAEDLPPAEADGTPPAENAPTTAGEALLAAVASAAVEEAPAAEEAAPAGDLPAAEAEGAPPAEDAPTAAGETLLAAVAETSPAPAPAQEAPAPEQETPAPEAAEEDETPAPPQEDPTPAAAPGAAAPADNPEPPPDEAAPDVTPAPADGQPPAEPPAPAAAPPAEAGPGTEPPPTADGTPAPAQGMPAPEEAPAPEETSEAPAPLEDAPAPPMPADTPAPTQEGGNT